MSRKVKQLLLLAYNRGMLIKVASEQLYVEYKIPEMIIEQERVNANGDIKVEGLEDVIVAFSVDQRSNEISQKKKHSDTKITGEIFDAIENLLKGDVDYTLITNALGLLKSPIRKNKRIEYQKAINEVKNFFDQNEKYTARKIQKKLHGKRNNTLSIALISKIVKCSATEAKTKRNKLKKGLEAEQNKLELQSTNLSEHLYVPKECGKVNNETKEKPPLLADNKEILIKETSKQPDVKNDNLLRIDKQGKRDSNKDMKANHKEQEGSMSIIEKAIIETSQQKDHDNMVRIIE
ncbi:hypothetical protein K502DRAFT_347721 [Neoconidiobolus thromboides FSU 785]|nr:hypothetical protein K502DRAFT_347721 [Neoconidiobolus thromboides FSU 785]